MFRRFSTLFLALGMGAIGFAGLTTASELPSTGLGQAWPNAADVSLSPHHHVYVFVRDGIRYIQANDANGTVRDAVATAKGIALALPVGLDAAHVQAVSARAAGQTASPDSSATETVYRDSATTVSATPQSDGHVLIATLVNGICTNPIECSNNGA